MLLYYGAWFTQTTLILMITKERYIKIVNFMIPGARVLVLGRGQTSYIVKCIIIFKNFLTPRHRRDNLSIW